jgi:hypothetical protein
MDETKPFAKTHFRFLVDINWRLFSKQAIGLYTGIHCQNNSDIKNTECSPVYERVLKPLVHPPRGGPLTTTQYIAFRNKTKKWESGENRDDKQLSNLDIKHFKRCRTCNIQQCQAKENDRQRVIVTTGLQQTTCVFGPQHRKTVHSKRFRSYNKQQQTTATSTTHVICTHEKSRHNKPVVSSSIISTDVMANYINRQR